MVKVLALAGSTRSGSYNKAILNVAAKGVRDAGASVTVVDLKDYPLPLYDADIEESQGLPSNAKTLKKLFIEHDALLIASPEYNSSISAILKNVIDWVSRQESDDEPNLAAYTGKVAAVMSASPSFLGGLRGLRHLREILTNIGVHVIPEQVTVPKAHEKIDDGTLTSEKHIKSCAAHGKRLASVTAKLVS